MGPATRYCSYNDVICISISNHSIPSPVAWEGQTISLARTAWSLSFNSSLRCNNPDTVSVDTLAVVLRKRTDDGCNVSYSAGRIIPHLILPGSAEFWKNWFDYIYHKSLSIHILYLIWQFYWFESLHESTPYNEWAYFLAIISTYDTLCMRMRCDIPTSFSIKNLILFQPLINLSHLVDWLNWIEYINVIEWIITKMYVGYSILLIATNPF